ncbi:hypothetical protein RR46_02110 [Papilio xuthus]|uniref:Uncharacterized protein n=1 Tax=Papilio xuthus TaxID=66420 RepID=A0A194QJA4_PAPXU|nr:hypothetical protein RR46_02110 [Papilio xuthus]
MSDSPSRGPLSGALETSHSMERPPKRSKSAVTSQPGQVTNSHVSGLRFTASFANKRPKQPLLRFGSRGYRHVAYEIDYHYSDSRISEWTDSVEFRPTSQEALAKQLD